MSKRARVNVRQDEAQPVARDVLAASIVKITAAVEALRTSGLNERALVTLLHDSTKVSKREISAVLDGLRDLRKDFTR